MDFRELNQIQIKKWHRTVLNGLWFIVIFSFLGECAAIFTTEKPMHIYLVNYLLIPTLKLIFVVIVAELIYKYTNRFHEYLTATASILVSAITIWSHPELDFIVAMFLLPVLTTMFYFNKKITIFIGVCNAVLYPFLIFLNPVLVEKTSKTELLTVEIMIFGATVISLSVMKRGIELLQMLEHELGAKLKLLTLTKIDTLTKLQNYKSFHEELDKSIKEFDPQLSSLILAIIDIDNFKNINDTFGHLVGDLVLQRVAEQIKNGMTHGNNEVFRYGGEEFAIILKHMSPQQAKDRLDMIRLNISQLGHFELNSASVTVSIGMHTYTQGKTKDQFFEQTDALMYLAKQKGKNKIVLEAVE